MEYKKRKTGFCRWLNEVKDIKHKRGNSISKMYSKMYQ